MVGIDHDEVVLKAIKDGFVNGTMLQNPYGQGYIGSFAADKLRTGCTVKADAPFKSNALTNKFIDSGTVFVDADQVDNYVSAMEGITKDLMADFEKTTSPASEAASHPVADATLIRRALDEPSPGRVPASQVRQCDPRCSKRPRTAAAGAGQQRPSATGSASSMQFCFTNEFGLFVLIVLFGGVLRTLTDGFLSTFNQFTLGPRRGDQHR